MDIIVKRTAASLVFIKTSRPSINKIPDITSSCFFHLVAISLEIANTVATQVIATIAGLEDVMPRPFPMSNSVQKI